MNKEGVVIAFDFGLKRIGCAVGQKLTGTASPIGTIKNNKKDVDWNKINLWLDEWQPQAIIVGVCLLYTSPSPRDATLSRMPSSA